MLWCFVLLCHVHLINYLFTYLLNLVSLGMDGAGLLPWLGGPRMLLLGFT